VADAFADFSDASLVCLTGQLVHRVQHGDSTRGLDSIPSADLDESAFHLDQDQALQSQGQEDFSLLLQA